MAPTAAEAVTGADIVITTTSSRTPILFGEWLNDHALVIAVGADSIGKRECDDTVLRRAKPTTQSAASFISDPT